MQHNQWARFVDCRGIEHDKAFKFENNRNGFNAILTRIYEVCKKEDFNKVIVGMEPTGHYWKAFANFLLKQVKIIVVLVNPYHTKKAKELDDKQLLDTMLTGGFNEDLLTIANQKATQLKRDRIEELKSKNVEVGVAVNLAKSWKTADYNRKKAVVMIMIDKIIISEDGSTKIVWNI